MRYFAIAHFLFLLGLLLPPSPATAAPSSSLRLLEKSALENNLNLRAVEYRVRANKAAERKGYGI